MSESESLMSQVQVEQQSYQMPPLDGFTVAYFLTVADIERSVRFHGTVFGGRILSRGDRSGAPGYIQIANFIRSLANSAVDMEIVSGIVRLARVMRIGTVAEYVADEAIANAAVNAGVDALQGHAIQPPIPLADALNWCRSSNAARWSEWTDPLVRQIVS
jgi:hypothetical protein